MPSSITIEFATPPITCFRLPLTAPWYSRNPPKDTRQNKVDCTNCGTSIPDYALVCPNPSCDTRFPVCIVSGRPLFDYQFWLCPSCKHRAYEQEIQSYKFCPLCHYEI